MKILYLAYLFPPVANSGTFRSAKFVKYLPRYGVTPLVVTRRFSAPSAQDTSLVQDLGDGSRVFRVPDVMDALRLGSSRISGGNRFLSKAMDGIGWRVVSVFRFPDEAAVWIPPALMASLRIFRCHRFHGIVASGWPWSSFFVAYHLSRGIGVPYVLDYRDLWRPTGVAWEGEFNREARRRQARWEQKILDEAAGVVTTTESFARWFKEEYGVSNVTCITNGYDSEDMEKVEPFPAKDLEQRITVAYAGVWRRGYSPEAIYASVVKLKEMGGDPSRKLRVIMCGFPPGRARSLGVEDIVQEYGHLPHDKALSLMASADVLFLPVSTGFYEDAHIPGKTFEYLGLGKPIIACCRRESAVGRVLRKTGGALFVGPGSEGVSELARVLARMIATPRRSIREIFPPYDPSEIARFERKALTRRLAEFLVSSFALASPR